MRNISFGIYIPKSVTSDTKRKNLESIFIPKSVTSIKEQAFQDCLLNLIPILS